MQKGKITIRLKENENKDKKVFSSKWKKYGTQDTLNDANKEIRGIIIKRDAEK